MTELSPLVCFSKYRSVVSGGAVTLWRPLASGAGLALVYLLVASWFFSRMYRHAVRTGLIARYSSETLN